MPGLTPVQIEKFYRTLECADSLAAAERQRLRRNLDGTPDKTEILQRFKACRTQHLNAATLFTLMQRPPKYALEGDPGDRQQSRLKRLYEQFKSETVLNWAFPEGVFSESDIAALSEDNAFSLINVVEEYADAVIEEAVLPLLNRDSSSAKTICHTIRTLMATAASLRRFRFESVESANQFFADACRRFLETREQVVEDYLNQQRFQELRRRIRLQTKRGIQGEKHEQDREDVVGDVLMKVHITLRDPRFPPPAERFASDDDLFRYVSRLTSNGVKDFFRNRGREDPTVPLPPEPRDTTVRPKMQHDDRWQTISRLLNEQLEQGFGTDSICTSIEAAENALIPGAAVALLMLMRRQHGEKGYNEDEALAEIQRAIDGTWVPGAKQFVAADNKDVSPAQIWEWCHAAWNSLLSWPGELPTLRLPQSWADVAQRLPASADITATELDNLRQQWLGFISALDSLRRWIVLHVLQNTSVEIPSAKGLRRFRPLTWKQMHDLLTLTDAGTTDAAGLSRDDDNDAASLSPHVRWSLINDQFRSAGLPSSWRMVQSWFTGRIQGGPDGLRMMSKRLLTGLKEYAGRKDRFATQGEPAASFMNGRHPVADVTQKNGFWYLATAVCDESSGQQGIQVMGSSSGADWRPIGNGAIVADQDVTRLRFEADSAPDQTDERAVPSIQLDTHDASVPASLLSSYSLDTNTWTRPEPVLPAGRLLSHLLWHEEHVWALVQGTTADGLSGVQLYSGCAPEQLQPCEDLSSTLADPDAADTRLLRDDLASATSAVLFSHDGELWCVLHCAGVEGRRTWIGVRASQSECCWEWWRSGTALFPQHRYVIPDHEEVHHAVRPGCAVSPAGVCQLEDGTWWLTGTTHEDGRAQTEDILFRVFLPERAANRNGTVSPVFCQTRTLGTGAASEVRHNGMASSGPIILTTSHAGRLYPASGTVVPTRLFHAVTAEPSTA